MAFTPAEAASWVNRLHAQMTSRSGALGKRESYFNGDQPLQFASEEWRKFHNNRFKGFSDNWCGVVGSAAADRTEVFGIRLGDDPDVQSPEERKLWLDWVTAGGPEKSDQGYLSSAYLSTSYALVWGAAEDVPSLTWLNPDTTIVHNDPETGEPKYALRAWTDDDATEHATLYSADEVWKFSRKTSANGLAAAGFILPPAYSLLAGGWGPREGAEPVVANPLGVLPIVEHPNRPLLSKGPISDIDGTMAMQDAINLMWAYLFGAADFAGMPARIVSGAERPMMPILDAEGQKIGEKPLDLEALTRGRMLWLTGEKSTTSSWDAAKLDVFTDVVSVAVKHVASQTRTPIHYIMGELGNVNGETLTALELPLATKVRKGHKSLTRPTREVFRRFALVRGEKAIADACRTAVIQWRNPETMSDAQVSDAATKDRSIGWPLQAIFERRYGMSQPEIERLMNQIKAEANDPLIQAYADLMGGSSNAPAPTSPPMGSAPNTPANMMGGSSSAPVAVN
jgi:hypothetical protein